MTTFNKERYDRYLDRSKPQLNALLLNEKKKQPINGFYIDENCKIHLYGDFGTEVYDSESVAVVD